MIRNAKLDFFKSEAEWQSAPQNPLNDHPVKLWRVSLEVDTRKFQPRATTLGSAVKQGVMGEGGRDFAVADLMASNNDLAHAAKYFSSIINKVFD